MTKPHSGFFFLTDMQLQHIAKEKAKMRQMAPIYDLDTTVTRLLTRGLPHNPKFQTHFYYSTMKCLGIISAALFLVHSLADSNDPVTCGSSIKLLHDPSVSSSQH